jgi:hypothetical protein
MENPPFLSHGHNEPWLVCFDGSGFVAWLHYGAVRTIRASARGMPHKSDMSKILNSLINWYSQLAVNQPNLGLPLFSFQE